MSDAAAAGQPLSSGSGSGAALLAERRRQGLSLGDISRQLKLSVRQVEALERDDYSGFKGQVFVHGFIRNYAKLLGLDPAPLILAADDILKPAAILPDPAIVAKPRVARAGSIGIRPLAIAVAVAVFLAATVLIGTRNDPEPNQGAATVPKGEIALSDQPVSDAKPEDGDRYGQANPDNAVSEPGERAIVRMVFDQESWVEIKDRGGNTIFGQTSPAGSRRSVSGEPPLTVVIGNAAGVRLFHNDRNVDLAPHTRVDVARLTLE